MKLYGKDVAKYAIVCTEDNESTATAAQELQSYLEKTAGAAPEIAKAHTPAIYIGANAPAAEAEIAKLKSEDGFVLKRCGGDFVIGGKSSAAALYGTYYFIEKYLGVEWLAPDCEIFTKDVKKANLVPDEVYDFTAFMRVCHNRFAYDEKYRARHRLTYTVGDTNDKPAYGGLRGLKFAFYWGYFGHTFEVLLPYEKYYAAHPEWYSFAEKYKGENHRYQICLTNPEVLKIVTENALAYLDAHPDCRIVSVSQNDSYYDFADNYCKCENCAKIWKEDGNYSAVLLQFVNKVAREVKKKYPDVWVHTFAYHFSADPPRTVVPDDNVLVQFCMHLPYGAWITDGGERSRKELQKAEDWRKLTGNLFAWTYICEHGNYLAPVGNLRALYENTSYFLRGRVKGLFQQERMDFYNCEFSEMRAYLTAKLFSDPYMDYGTYLGFVKTFLSGFYGAGGKFLYEYLLLLDEKYRGADVWAMTEEEKLRFFADGAFIAAGEKLYAEAESAGGTKEQKERLAHSRLQLDFCKLAAAYLAGEKGYPDMRRAFTEKLTAAGVKKYREGAAIPPADRLDYSKSPFLFAQVDKTVRAGRSPCAPQRAGDSTCPVYGFDFSFTAAYFAGVLLIEAEIRDGEIFTQDNNIESWEQDCVEIYVSETCNRTAALRAGDYKIRVNAHGVSDAFGSGEKVKSCKAKRTNTGYAVTAELYLSGTEKIGFELIAHDFGADGKYKSTRYWNALKNADVFNAPYHYGIMEIKD